MITNPSYKIYRPCFFRETPQIFKHKSPLCIRAKANIDWLRRQSISTLSKESIFGNTLLKKINLHDRKNTANSHKVSKRRKIMTHESKKNARIEPEHLKKDMIIDSFRKAVVPAIILEDPNLSWGANDMYSLVCLLIQPKDRHLRFITFEKISSITGIRNVFSYLTELGRAGYIEQSEGEIYL